MKHHKIFSLPKSLWALLLLSNIAFAEWLEVNIGSYWGWTVVDLSSDIALNLATALAILQFAIFAFTIDMLVRVVVTSVNHKLKVFQVPAITVMAMSITVYAVVGLLGFILLYDHSLSHILAATGALGVGIVYIFREWIADVMASIQIQTDNLASINDYIQLVGEEDVYRVAQIDHRMITIEDKFHYLIHIPARNFSGWKYINISKQPSKRGVKRRCKFNLTTQNNSDRVLEMMETAMQYLIAKDRRFHPGYACQLQQVEGGMISYGISYECDPSLSMYASNDCVLRPLLLVMNAAAINLNSDIEVTRPKVSASGEQQRLMDIYGSSILKALSWKQIQELSLSVKSIHVEAGDHLIQLGERAQSMYIISEGHLEVGIPGKDGQDVIVATLWPGDCVGEMSLLTGESRSANVYAKSRGVLIEVTRDSLEPFLKSTPTLIEEISRILTNRKTHNEKALTSQADQESSKNQIKLLAEKIYGFFFGS